MDWSSRMRFITRVAFSKVRTPLIPFAPLRGGTRFLVQLFAGSLRQEFPPRISLRLPAKDHRADCASAHAFSYLLPPQRATLIFAYELPDSPRHPRWLQVIHLPTQKLVRLLRRVRKIPRQKSDSPGRQNNRCFADDVAAVIVVAIFPGEL